MKKNWKQNKAKMNVILEKEVNKITCKQKFAIQGYHCPSHSTAILFLQKIRKM